MSGRRLRSLVVLMLGLVSVAGCRGQGAGLTAPARAEDRFAALLTVAPDAWQREGDRLVSPGWRSGRMGTQFELGARLPARADGALEVAVGRSEAHTLRLVPEGARPVPLALVDGRAVFAAAYQDTDAIVTTTAQRVEVFYLLKSARAPHELRWRVELPAALPQARFEPGGALVFAERGGTARLRVPPPYAVDASGVRREAELVWADGTLTVRLDPTGLVFPVLLDPAVETAFWQQKTPAHSPPGRYEHVMVYDPARKQTVLFGGWTGPSGGTTYGDTWVWNGTDWSQLSPATRPSARRGSAMVFDSTRNVAVLYGGGSKDTWEWDGSTWALRCSNCAPGNLLDLGMAYDSARGVTVLYGGFDNSGNYHPETYEYTAPTWTLKGQGAYRVRHAMVYDPVHHASLSIAGWDWIDTGAVIEWNGTEWTPSPWSVSARSFPAAAYDPNRARTVMFGGCVTSGQQITPNVTAWYGDTWERDSTTYWTRVASSGPAPRGRAAMAFDSDRRRVVLFGGEYGASGSGNPTTLYGDTWEYYTHGGPCTADSQCDTGHCVDGVCCESASCPQCQDCNAGNPGVCTTITGTDDNSTVNPCNGSSTCSASGACGLKNGRPCTSACASGNCSDGVCCDTPCTASCDVCTLALGATADGACTTAPARSAGSPSCSPHLCDGTSVTCPTGCLDDTFCATGYICNSVDCVLAGKDLGEACVQDRECGNGRYCVDNVCCESQCLGACNTCQAGTGACLNVAGPGNPSCGAYNCSGAGPDCPTSCASDADCQAGYFCASTNGGTCQLRHQQGQSCNVAADCKQPGACGECLSGHCVGGVCCDQACSGACNECSSGACANLPHGFLGSGCGDYVCPGTGPDCLATCAGDDDCAPGRWCDGLHCQPKLALGAGCTTDHQCGTGFCENQVCCDARCGSACDACNAAGHCQNVAGAGSPSCGAYVCSGLSPLCPDSCTSDAVCAAGYYCNGTACVAKLAVGATCTSSNQCQSPGGGVPGTCADGRCCDAPCGGNCDACNASGHCAVVTAGTAGNPPCPGGLLCDGAGASCPGSCASDNDCVTNYFCKNGACWMQLPTGSPCTRERQCELGHCVDNYCCDSACAGGCDRCNLSPGACAVVPAGDPGADPSCGGYVCDGQHAACPTSCTSDDQCAAGRHCDGGTCVGGLADGAACTRGRECGSGLCVDLVCCKTPCNGGCDVCNVSGDGTCTPVAQGEGGANPQCAPYVCDGTSAACPTSCAGAEDCNASSYCSAGHACVGKKGNGQTCDADDQCVSDQCRDGFCCDDDCAGNCDRCDISAGHCLAVGRGDPGAPSCSPYVCDGASRDCPSTCADDTACAVDTWCDGSGACVPAQATGSACDHDRQCGSGFCRDGFCCDTACGGACDECASTPGVCSKMVAGEPGAPSCTPYVCNGRGASCPQGCVDDAGCIATNFCNAGVCVPGLPQAASCQRDHQCATGFCRDGFCCDADCSGPCDACNGAQPGTCVILAAGAVGAPPCEPYLCDGREPTCPTGCTDSTQCAAGSYCTGGVCFTRKATGAGCTQDSECISNHCVDQVCCQSECSLACSTCSSAASPGVCVPAGAGQTGRPACAPYLCNGTATTCPTWCLDDTGCTGGYHCIYGACLTVLPQGQPCGSNNACASGNCYDGVCCDMQCDGACMVCNLPGSVGSCTPAPEGTDPRFLCPGSGPCKSTCGAGGLCAYPGASKSCGEPARCASATVLDRGSACDGQGSCVDQGTRDCAPYLCAGGVCPTSCGTDSDCAPGTYCDGATCGAQLTAGAPCARSAQCASTYCVDGVCCESACDRRCERCDLPPASGGALDGQCRVPVGEDPDLDCTGEGVCAGTCQADRTCAFPGPDTACDTCKACNRAGACSVMPASSDDPACGAVACAALTTECRTYNDLTAGRCAALGLCVRPNDPDACNDYTDQPDGTPCTGGACVAGECVAGWDGGLPIGDGGGAADGPGAVADKGCGCRAGGPPGAGPLGALILALCLWRRRRT